MAIGRFEFFLKRGEVALDSIEDDRKKAIIEECIRFCKRKEHKDAVTLLYSVMRFEFNWLIGDGDPSEILEPVEDVAFVCNRKNTSIKAGAINDTLEITVTTSFECKLKDGITTLQVDQWLFDNGAYARGCVDGGWSYDGWDTCDIRIIGLK